jgi:hypothetical protein
MQGDNYGDSFRTLCCSDEKKKSYIGRYRQRSMVMTRLGRVLLIMGLGVGLGIGMLHPVGAQEVPTGAARIVEKVQLRIFISKTSLTFNIADVVENQPVLGPRE